MTESALGMLDRVRLEKAATDAGFDVRQDATGGWMSFASTSSPLRISLTVTEAKPVAALSMGNVLTELSMPSPASTALPVGTAGAFVVSHFSELQAALARAYELANALPTVLLETWHAQVKSLPATERDATVRQRVGQELFRNGLLALWRGRCALTGLAVPELLRASHAKPWRVATDEERLDVYNGLLLTAHLDAAFDIGLVGFTVDGKLRISPRLGTAELSVLGLNRPWAPINLRPQHVPYLDYHYNNVFMKA